MAATLKTRSIQVLDNILQHFTPQQPSNKPASTTTDIPIKSECTTIEHIFTIDTLLNDVIITAVKAKNNTVDLTDTPSVSIKHENKHIYPELICPVCPTISKTQVHYYNHLKQHVIMQQITVEQLYSVPMNVSVLIDMRQDNAYKAIHIEQLVTRKQLHHCLSTLQHNHHTVQPHNHMVQSEQNMEIKQYECVACHTQCTIHTIYKHIKQHVLSCTITAQQIRIALPDTLSALTESLIELIHKTQTNTIDSIATIITPVQTSMNYTETCTVCYQRIYYGDTILAHMKQHINQHEVSLQQIAANHSTKSFYWRYAFKIYCRDKLSPYHNEALQIQTIAVNNALQQMVTVYRPRIIHYKPNVSIKCSICNAVMCNDDTVILHVRQHIHNNELTLQLMMQNSRCRAVSTVDLLLGRLFKKLPKTQTTDTTHYSTSNNLCASDNTSNTVPIDITHDNMIPHGIVQQSTHYTHKIKHMQSTCMVCGVVCKSYGSLSDHCLQHVCNDTVTIQQLKQMFSAAPLSTRTITLTRAFKLYVRNPQSIHYIDAVNELHHDDTHQSKQLKNSIQFIKRGGRVVKRKRRRPSTNDTTTVQLQKRVRLNKDPTPMNEYALCELCYDRERSVICLPCMHYKYCHTCIQQWKQRCNNKLTCPYCNANVKRVKQYDIDLSTTLQCYT